MPKRTLSKKPGVGGERAKKLAEQWIAARKKTREEVDKKMDYVDGKLLQLSMFKRLEIADAQELVKCEMMLKRARMEIMRNEFTDIEEKCENMLITVGKIRRKWNLSQQFSP